MAPMSQFLHNCIKFYIICGVVISYMIQFLAKKCYWFTFLAKYSSNAYMWGITVYLKHFIKMLNEVRKNYSTYDVEFYAILQGLRHRGNYFVPKEFVLFTDQYVKPKINWIVDMQNGSLYYKDTPLLWSTINEGKIKL